MVLSLAGMPRNFYLAKRNIVAENVLSSILVLFWNKYYLLNATAVNSSGYCHAKTMKKEVPLAAVFIEHASLFLQI